MTTEFEPTPFGLPSDGGGKDLGVFMPMANGGWILSKNAPPLDGSYAYNRKVALLAEEAGLDFIMSMAKYRGYGGETHHWENTLDPTAMMSALAEATSRVKVWTTVHTILQNPAVVAKMIATLDQISNGRAGLNVVTGAYKGEFSQMGAWPEGIDHDARYDLAYEWIRAIKALWTEKSVTMHGQYFTLDDCMSDPKPSTRPFLVCAGTSKKGMRFTSEEMDAIFLSGGDPKELAEASRRAKDDAAELGRTVRTYSMMTVVFGETDAAAQATAEHFRAGLDEEALKGMMRAYGFLDSEIGKENAFVAKSRSTFMAPHVLGTPATVVEQLGELFEVSGIDGLMLIFPDYIAGLPIFGQEVLPALRARFPSRLQVAAHA
ncbi:LLM class flavin-dependent oxidoreductase [Sphingomonas oleivorans]|uniref:LLM class flavin-dependent oxidoreductase n=1 Tax=Sphingomonas oleivorans TaxID=1735121 RepID=A0A2T5FZA0_9SPHN|nr:LLM class flavin-dependent oxidoreductase [Sphingomonas oleivorans]PTQ11893.1 LLM class flavin-dependent oxidoreductase [Sphingomonas oleivorans]